MALPVNSFQNVQTYQKSELALLQNLNCFISTYNTEFKNFEKREANLGDTVTFDTPPRFVASDGLVVTYQASQQLVQPLTIDKAKNVSTDYTNQQWIFNLEPMEYMEKFGRSAVAELASAVEQDVARNTIINSPYRFYGDGVTPINSYGQIAEALAKFRNYGATTNGKLNMYLQDTAIPAIINSGLNQFVLKRNEDTAMSWMLGEFDNCKFMRSNLLPQHTSGTIGQASTVLTVTSTNDPTGAAISTITFSNAGTDANAIKAGDLLVFNDGVSGQPDMRYLTWTGHAPSANKVQFRATADAVSSGGNVTISIYPTLQSTVGSNQNLSYNVAAGMQVSVMPSHRRGVIICDKAAYIAMPALPDEVPFPTVSEYDPETAVAMRMYYGSIFGQNQRAFVHDCIWGSTAVPQYTMAVLFPV